MIDRRRLLLGTLAAGLAARAAAAPPPGPPLPEPDEWLDLWPGEAPGMPDPPPAEEVRERSTDPSFNDRAIFHVHRPRLAIFRPALAIGGAVLLTPGGAYARVVMDKEGFETARWLARRGVTAFVLFYRLAMDHWTSGADTPIADAHRAMRLVRARMPGAKVALLGFSAGGHVAADLVARFEADARPDAAGLLYPVIAMSGPAAHAESRLNLLGPNPSAEDERIHDPSRNVRADSPPCFLVHAEDDPVIPVANTLLMREALRARGVQTETHLFPTGGHGFGIRLASGHSVEIWPDLFFAWGRRQGLWA
ncbi:MAG: alpha/beta hydrolase [Sphingomonadaceae bacterium]|nr:alpha/beta hydrolase [Sphingomonadaceae bacterium]